MCLCDGAICSQALVRASVVSLPRYLLSSPHKTNGPPKRAKWTHDGLDRDKFKKLPRVDIEIVLEPGKPSVWVDVAVTHPHSVNQRYKFRKKRSYGVAADAKEAEKNGPNPNGVGVVEANRLFYDFRGVAVESTGAIGSGMQQLLMDIYERAMKQRHETGRFWFWWKRMLAFALWKGQAAAMVHAVTKVREVHGPLFRVDSGDAQLAVVAFGGMYNEADVSDDVFECEAADFAVGVARQGPAMQELLAVEAARRRENGFDSEIDDDEGEDGDDDSEMDEDDDLEGDEDDEADNNSLFVVGDVGAADVEEIGGGAVSFNQP